MKCEFCGEINEYGAHFCKKCGAEIGKVQNGAAGILGDKAVAKTKDLAKNLKSKLSKKVLIIIGVCVVALIAIIIAINAFLPGKYTYPKNTISFLYDSEFEQTSVLVDTKLLSTTIDGSVYSTQNNFDGDVCAVLSSDDTLYYITSSTVQSIADEVGYFALSSQGDAVAYIDSDATLYIYSADDSKKTKVEDEVEDSYVVISPDGKTVAYLIDDDESKLYVYTNGKSTLVGKELAAIAVSNSGKYIYSYREENEALYVSELGGDKNKLAADVDTDYFILNKDHTEIIFTADSKSYISIKGGDKEKIGSSSSLTPLFPAKTLYVYRLYCVYSCPVSELLDNVFEDYYNDNLYNLYYINNEYESDKLA
ncbi:MAG: zinc ribbon domain-containing protein, partial [Thermoplasmata archaeon]|nr:zinc ribbon domain-containing protein [Thermoplasmata archaeon]